MKVVIPDFHARILFRLQPFGIEAGCHCHGHEEVSVECIDFAKEEFG
jgi:hypothetical protein